MIRNVDISTVSDGKKYKANDLVKIGCNECKGCSECCKNMHGLITLDPYDVSRIINGLTITFESLLNSYFELISDDGILLPALKMKPSGECVFLNDDGRCSIHKIRPGICRLFPLGRLYEDDSFYYFLQKDECSYKNKTKVKVKNWLETEELPKYEKFVCDWHIFLKKIREYIKTSDDMEVRQINTALLQIFYIRTYSDFYDDFYSRLEDVKKLL